MLRALDERGNVRALADVELEMIKLAIDHYNGQMSEVARRLGIGRSTLYRKLKEYGIDPEAPPRRTLWTPRNEFRLPRRQSPVYLESNGGRSTCLRHGLATFRSISWIVNHWEWIVGPWYLASGSQIRGQNGSLQGLLI